MSRRIARAAILPKSSTVALLLVVGLTACDMPSFQGPQLQTPPQGFLLQPGSRAGRSMFAHLPEIHHDAWVQSQLPYSTIRINGYAGTLTVEDVLAAQDSARAHAPDPEITFSGVEPLTIDDREAWGWEERIDTPTRGIPWVAYRVMVPYEDVSYSIEFSTEDPLYKAGAPGTLIAVVSTFGVGETVYDWPLIGLAMGLLLFALHMMRQRAKARTARLQSINLVKIEKKETEGDDATSEGDGRPAPRGATAAPPTRGSPVPPPTGRAAAPSGAPTEPRAGVTTGAGRSTSTE